MSNYFKYMNLLLSVTTFCLTMVIHTSSWATDKMDETADPLLENTVHAHTRLNEKLRGHANFDKAMERLAKMGAEVVIKHYKSGKESAMWMFPENLQKMGQNAPLVSQSTPEPEIIAYYWIMSDQSVADAHPEWKCRNANGRWAKSLRGDTLDITSDYREVILENLTKISESGVAGIYFDSNHLPKNGCYGTPLETRFRDKYKYRKKRLPKNLFVEYQAQEINRFFDYLRESLKKKFPNLRLIISAGQLPTLLDRSIDSGLAATADFPKSEYHTAIRSNLAGLLEGTGSVPHVAPNALRMGFGWSLLRDSAAGRPPHIWNPTFDSMADASRFVWHVTTFGGIANINIPEQLTLGNKTSEVDYESLFRLGREIGNAARDAKPVTWAGVYFSEEARNAGESNSIASSSAILVPLAAYECLAKMGVPTTVVNDRNLLSIHPTSYPVMVSPNRNMLNSQHVRVLEKFSADGGIWIEAPLKPFDEAQFSDLCRRLNSLDRPPISVRTSGDYVYSNFFESNSGGYLIGLAAPGNRPVDPTKQHVEILFRSPARPSANITITGTPLEISKEDNFYVIKVPAFQDGIFVSLSLPGG